LVTYYPPIPCPRKPDPPHSHVPRESLDQVHATFMPDATQARLKMGVLAYNLLHLIRQFYVWGEEVGRSIDWLIKRLIKVGARVSYHARR
jgi:hypothetical protein